MLFSRQLSLSVLAGLCRVLRHNLGAGLSLADVFTQQGQRGPASLRPVAARLGLALKSGTNLGAALEQEKDSFPPLFLALASVGEETGHTAEIFGEMENYFALQMRLRRQFISQSILPVIQFVFAIFLIAGLIWILGAIAGSRGQPAITLFGLSGARGALIYLGTVFGVLGALMLMFAALRRLRHQAWVHEILLKVPIFGPCFEAITLNRLAVCLRLTLDSGMAIRQGVRLSLTATGNAAYAARAGKVTAALKKGEPLVTALTRLGLLPPEFIDLIATAEEGGTVPEMMRHQAEHYEEETTRRLTTLTRAASTALWLTYAGFVIYAIFSIAQLYLGALGV